MLDIKALKIALEQLEQEKKIGHEKVVDAVEKSLAAAYQKEYGKRGQIVRCQINFDTGETSFEQVKIVVDETTVRMPIEGEEEVFEAAPSEGADAEGLRGELIDLFASVIIKIPKKVKVIVMEQTRLHSSNVLK